MDDTWYYTLSTIAQTLAAILGLATVFVTIRLKDDTDKLKEYMKRAYRVIKIIENHQSGEMNSGSVIERSASGLLKDLKEIEKDYSKKYEINSGIKPDIEKFAKSIESYLYIDNLSFLKDTIGYLSIYRKKRKQLFELVKWPGIFSSGTIIYTIILLSMSRLFYCDRIFAMQLFTLAVVFSIYSILRLIHASWELLKNSMEIRI